MRNQTNLPVIRKNSAKGECSFIAWSAKLWNSQPDELKRYTNLSLYKKQLKLFLSA